MQTYEVDLVSDNAVKPTAGMRRFMCDAPVGDEEWGEDPTVCELEELVAGLTAKDDAVFMPTGTMCNVVSFFLHCGVDGEVLLHEDSHPVYSGYGGPAVPGRPLLRGLPGERGVLAPDTLRQAAGRFPAARVVSLENTHNRTGGSVWSVEELEQAGEAAHELGLRVHLDGARLPNAAVASGRTLADLAAPADVVWIDLSKGLGCPVGAVLAGDGRFVAEARRAKYLFGGLMHKAGIVAAAGVYALRNHVERLAEDHRRAADLAAGLAELPGVRIDQPRIETNIVYFDVADAGLTARTVQETAARHSVRFKPITETRLRAVTHLDIGDEHVRHALAAVRSALALAPVVR